MLLTLRAALLIPIVAIDMRARGFQRVKARVESVAAGTRRPADECVLALRRARRYSLFRGNCLSQSLALVWMLRRAGHDAVVQIGVKPGLCQMRAHAWVELNGTAIDPAAIASEYAPLLT